MRAPKQYDQSLLWQQLESLGDDPGLCIRQVLQNALDALELRVLRLKIKQKGEARAFGDGELIRPGWVRELTRPRGGTPRHAGLRHRGKAVRSPIFTVRWRRLGRFIHCDCLAEEFIQFVAKQRFTLQKIL